MEVVTLTKRLDRIRTGLHEAAKRKLTPFGYSSHHFLLAPVTAVAEVAKFELLCGSTLPADYRTFITTLGDGGAGPGLGLLSLLEALTYPNDAKSPELLRQQF